MWASTNSFVVTAEGLHPRASLKRSVDADATGDKRQPSSMPAMCASRCFNCRALCTRRTAVGAFSRMLVVTHKCGAHGDLSRCSSWGENIDAAQQSIVRIKPANRYSPQDRSRRHRMCQRHEHNIRHVTGIVRLERNDEQLEYEQGDPEKHEKFKEACTQEMPQECE